MGVAHIYRHPELDAMSIVEEVVEGDCQFRATMFKLDITFGEMFLTLS